MIDRESSDTADMGLILDAGAAAARRSRPLDRGRGAFSSKVPASREKFWRSLAKAVSWRVTGSLDTFVLAFLFTGNARVSAAIGLTEIGTKIVLYTVHERVWARIGFGLGSQSPEGEGEPAKAPREPEAPP